MAKRLTNRQRLAFKIETLSENEVGDLLEYIGMLETVRRPASNADIVDDELVNYLADAEENRRARQVLEWEKVRRRADLQADNSQAAYTYAGKY